MIVTLNPEWLRTCMDLWRDAAHRKVRSDGDLEFHFPGAQASLLEGFSGTAKSWLMVLRACKASSVDQDALAQLQAEVVALDEWARRELDALRRPSQEKCIGVKVRLLRAHRDTANATRPLLDQPRPDDVGSSPWRVLLR
jgi:hypothetical protein